MTAVIKCNSEFGYGENYCIIDMSVQESICLCCDTAEECYFDRKAILLRCEHAEEVIIGKEVQNEG